MSLDEKLAKLILDVAPPTMHMVRKHVRAIAKDNLTIPQLRVLAHVSRGLKTISELTEIQGVAQPTMTKMVNGLCKRSLLSKCKNASDKRNQDITITKEGKDLLNKTRKKAQKKISKILKDLSEEQKKELISSFQVIDKYFKTFFY